MAPALIMGVSACGGDGGESTQASDQPSLTKAQFLAKANAICRRGTKEMAKLDIAAWKRLGGPTSEPTEAQREEVALALLPVREKEIRLIRTLGLPKGDEAYVDSMLTDWEEGIVRGRKDNATLLGAENNFAFRKSYEMGLDYGLIDCWLS